MQCTFSDMPRSVNEEGQLIEDHLDDRLTALGSELSTVAATTRAASDTERLVDIIQDFPP
jgi:hypothetical protein